LVAGVDRAEVVVAAVAELARDAVPAEAAVVERADVAIVARRPVGGRLVQAPEIHVAGVDRARVVVGAARREGTAVRGAGRTSGRVVVLGELDLAVVAGRARHEAVRGLRRARLAGRTVRRVLAAGRGGHGAVTRRARGVALHGERRLHVAAHRRRARDHD